MKEMWKKVQDSRFSEFYSVSSFGRVMNNITNKLLTPYLNKKRGYSYISLKHKENRKNFIHHRLVAMAFCKNDKPEEYKQVDHLDYNKLNNNAYNLRWCSASQNGKRNYDDGMRIPTWGEYSGASRLTSLDVIDIRQMWKKGTKQKEIAKKFGIRPCTVSQIVNKKRWKYL